MMLRRTQAPRGASTTRSSAGRRASTPSSRRRPSSAPRSWSTRSPWLARRRSRRWPRRSGGSSRSAAATWPSASGTPRPSSPPPSPRPSASVEQRFADWGSEIVGLQQSLSTELERIGARQQQLIAAVEAKVVGEAERLESIAGGAPRPGGEDPRGAGRSRSSEVAGQVADDLESHGAERRQALQQLAERLRRREQELAEQIEREQTESTQRIGSQLQDIERRSLEQVKRVVARESQHLAEAAATQFDGTIRTAREEAAKRLGRELDLSVERFAREAESVLAERVESELRIFEARLTEI